jgi:uncharacterized membrane protein
MPLRQFFQLQVLSLLVASFAHAESAFFMSVPSTGPLNWVARTKLSGDGRVVLGGMAPPEFPTANPHLFRWTLEDGVMSLGFRGIPGELSGDGSVAVGTVFGGAAFRWTEQTGLQELHPTGAAWAVSRDGSVVALTPTINFNLQAYRWDTVNGLSALADGVFGQAFGVSADGNVIVGSPPFPGGWYWTEATGMVELGPLPSGNSGAHVTEVSTDGSIIAGVVGSPGSSTAGRWSESTGWVPLPKLMAGFQTEVTGISGDGSIIVGYDRPQGSNVYALGSKPFIWDVVHGTRDLATVLREDYGLAESLTGWDLLTAFDISEDGRTIVGDGIPPGANHRSGWIAHLGTPVPEPSSWTLFGIAAAVAIAVRITRRSRPIANGVARC